MFSHLKINGPYYEYNTILALALVSNLLTGFKFLQKYDFYTFHPSLLFFFYCADILLKFFILLYRYNFLDFQDINPNEKVKNVLDVHITP